jgi:hypothetical protein
VSSVATGIAIGAATSGGVASQQAAEAKRIACESFVKDYEHNTATVHDRRQYAQCIQLLQPVEVSGSAALLLKVCIVCGLIGGVVWGWRAWRDSGDWIVALGIWFMVTLAAGIAPFILALMAYAVAWVVTA